MKIRGVNLGNWLVLEKWMKKDMFRDTEAEDETYLCKNLSAEEKKRRYEEHRRTYITREDFRKIAEAGFNAVRIPVPYFLFEDFEPFIHCYEFLDEAFNWAEQYKLKILVDLHTVPGSQNGSDNSGLCGVCTWSTKEEYLNTTLDVLEKIAVRYGTKESLWGIEVLNEPMCNDTPAGKYLNIEVLGQLYHPADPEMAKDNTNYPLSYLQDFYRSAYGRIRKHMPKEKAVVFSDAFFLEGWEDFFKEPIFENIVLDTHQYLAMMGIDFNSEKTVEMYTDRLEKLEEKLAVLAEKIPVIVGEWSLSNEAADHTADDGKAEVFRQIYRAYRKAIDVCEGWFYWSYKLENDAPDILPWDMRKCLENEWVTMD